jgi:CDP-diacylglycerol--serine O-phosphatidyltransferase
VLETKRQQTEGGSNKYYRGLPVTAISMIFPLVYLFRGVFAEEIFALILHAMLLLTAFLFVLDFKVKKLNFSKLFSKHV